MWAWLVGPGPDDACHEVGASSRRQSVAHVALLLALVGISSIPPVRRELGIHPLALAGLLASQLVSSLEIVRRRAAELWPRAGWLLAPVASLAVSAGIPALTGRPWTLTWAVYFVAAMMAARAAGPSLLLAGLVGAIPFAVGLAWHAASVASFSESAGALATVALFAAPTHLLVANAAGQARKVRAEIAALRAREEAEAEREAIARSLEARLGRLLEQTALALDDAAGCGPQAGAGLLRAQERARRALAELRACVSSLDRGEVARRALVQLLEAHAEDLAAALGGSVSVQALVPPVVPADTAYHLVKLCEQAVQLGLLAAGAGPIVLAVEQAAGGATIRAEAALGAGPGEAALQPGLDRLRESAASLQGSVELAEAPGRLRLVVRAPLPNLEEIA